MVRIKEEKKILTTEEKKEVRNLERKREHLFDLLAQSPGNRALVTTLNELDIKICRITAEKTIDY